MSGVVAILFPILFPAAAGFILLFTDWFEKPGKLRGYTLACLAGNGIAVLLLFAQGEHSLTLWQLSDQMKIYFHIDKISVLFGILVSFVWLLAGIYAFTYMHHEHKEKRFFSFYILSLGILMGIIMAGNIITMYIFYEIMTLATLPFVIHSETKEAVAAGFKYLFYSLAGAFMGLFGIFFLFFYSGGMEFSPGGILNMELVSGNEGILLLAIFVMIVGFGTKAGMFPMHGWLPTAHPVAPAPASAVLSGIITKMGVLCIIRLVFYVAGADFIRGTWVQYAWMILALITVFMGSMMAYKEKIMKKRLAYSSVSQLSYILFGLSVLHPLGFAGALLHVVFHALIKNALFLVAGAIIFETGRTKAEEYTGIGKRMPFTIGCYTIVSLGLIGIPPLSGFISKWYLSLGAMNGQVGIFSYLGPAVLLISALLTAGYLLPVTIQGYFTGNGEGHESDKDEDGGENEPLQAVKKEPSLLMRIPIFAFAAGTVFFGVLPAGLYFFVEQIANLVM